MSFDWGDFLAEDAYGYRQWPEESDFTAETLSAAHIPTAMPPTTSSCGYPPYNSSAFEPQYTASPPLPHRVAQTYFDKPSSRDRSENLTPAYEDQYTSIPIAPASTKNTRPKRTSRLKPAMSKIEEVEGTQLPPSETTAITKRTKNGADDIAACWTSPLCPNHSNDDGSPPDPSTCGSACAPFLFAGAQDSLATALDETFMANEISIEADAQQTPVETTKPVQGMKRSESDTDDVPKGRSVSDQVRSRPDTKDGSPSQGDDTSPDGSHEVPEPTNSKPRGRQPHNQVERKYRESLNTQLESLRRVVPSLRPTPIAAPGTSPYQTADIEDLPVPSKPSKAVVLASATAYIGQMEKEKKQLAEKVKLLESRVSTLQALVKCDDCSLMQYVVGLNLSGKQ